MRDNMLFERLNKNRPLTVFLSVVVVLVMTWTLILPAKTLTKSEAEKQGGIDVQSSQNVADDQTAAEEKIFSDGKLMYDGEGFDVIASFKKSVQLPENISLSVREILEKIDPEEYKTYFDKAFEAVQKDAGKDKVSSIEFANLYDIAFIADGEEIEPDGKVKVTISYDQALDVKEADQVRIIHFTRDGKTGEVTAELLKDSDVQAHVRHEKMDRVKYDADSISVFAVVCESDKDMVKAEEKAADKSEKAVADKAKKDDSEEYQERKAETKKTITKDSTKKQFTKKEPEKDSSEEDAFNKEESVKDASKKDDQSAVVEPGVAGTKLFIGDGFGLKAIYDEKAGIPKGADLFVREIKKKSDKEEYQKYYEETLRAIQDNSDAASMSGLSFAKFYDITFSADGEEIEPDDTVQVTISYDEALKAKDPDHVRIIHFAENKKGRITAEVLDPSDVRTNARSGKMSKAAFRADSFSVYAVVYTVDFKYAVNGKMYDYSIPGGGFISLQQLVELLGIANPDAYDENNSSKNEKEEKRAKSRTAYADTANKEIISLNDVAVSEATKSFVSDVVSVEFSDPDLAWVGKTEELTTVGQMKKANELECRYSAELSKDQIAEINDSSVESGDWALISMLPFTSEETLTVTMKDGEVFTVNVTDGQIFSNVLTADGKTYCITVTYDDAAEIPVGTRLAVEEIEQGSEEFIKCVAETLGEVNKDYCEQQALLKSGEDPDCVESTPLVSMDQARFFHVTLTYKGSEIEPKTPVHVDIKYDDGLGVKGIDERIPGVSHFTNNSVEVISEVTTETDKKGNIVEFEYMQDSFSDIGTYVAHEGHDRLTKADAPSVNLGSGEVKGTRGTSSVDEFKAQNGAPEASKALKDNGDGTYTLSLNVKPKSSEYTVDSKKANVLFIMDRSSSMNYDSQASYLQFESEEDALASLNDGQNVYGIVNGAYTALSYLASDGGGIWTSPTGRYDTSVGLFYGISGTRFAQEQAALDNLIQGLMAKNEGAGNSDNVEIAILSFSTYAGSDQKYTYVGGTGTNNWGTDSDHPTHPWGNTEVGWTNGTDTTALINAVNDNSMARGTNWEEALKKAKVIMDGKQDTDGDEEDYYVVFLTDGAPTATSWSCTQRPPEHEWGAWYGNGTNHPNNNPPAYQNNAGIPYAYDDAKDDAKDLVAAGNQLFNIFTYGEGDDYKYMVRLTNYAYSDGTDDSDNEGTDAVGQYFKNAQNTSELVDYFNKIFKVITGNIGHSQVKIKDGLTQGAMTSSFVDGKPSAVHYTVTPSQGSSMRPYTVQATMPEEGSEPVVTFTINGQPYSTTSGEVQKKTNPSDAYDAGTYYSVTVGGVEYKIALASVTTGGEITWDLTPLGILWDDCDYKAEFVVWPKQEAYNYVAGLNNGMEGFTWNQESAVEHTDSQGRKYWSDGVAEYPSIVKYEDGTFAVLTNTHQEVEYSVSQVEDGKEIATEEQEPEGLPFPDPMPLNSTKTNLTKQWSVDRNPAILAQYLYNPDGTPTEFVAKFDILSDNNTDPFATVSLGWDDDLQQYVWDESSLRRVVSNGHVYYIGTRWSDEINIATGLMVTQDRMEALGLNPAEYPKATYQGTIYYILERGHDYHVKENAAGDELGYEFDFEAPVFHPMLVNGKMVNIVFEEEMDEEDLSLTEPYPIEKMIPAPMNAIGSLVVENTLRGYINVEKIVVDKDGKTVKSDDTTKFNYLVELNSDLDPGPFTEEGSHVPWYGIDGLFYHAEIHGTTYYFQADPLGGNLLSLRTESGDTFTAETTSGEKFDPDIVGPTEITYVDGDNNPVRLELHGNQMVHDSDNYVYDTIQIKQGQILNIANVPKGTTYTITEQDLDADYDLIRIESQIRDGDTTISRREVDDTSSGSFTGEIVSNRDNHVIFTNKIHSADLKVKKVGENGKALVGAQFKLTKEIVEPETEAQTWTLPEEGTTDTGTYTFVDLPDGVYTLEETVAPPNYTGIDPITFVVVKGVIYMPGDTLPEGVTLPDDAALPDGVTWNNNNNKTFSLTIPNTQNQPGPDEIRVEKRWEDENGNAAEGTRDVKVQLRRKMPVAHDVTVVFHSDGWSGGAEINDSTTFRSIPGDQITIEFMKPTRFAQNVVPPVTSSSGTVQGPSSNGDRWRTVVSNVRSDITVTIDYSGYNWQLVNQNNNPPIQRTVTVVGNGQGGGDYVIDPDFPAEGDTNATQTLKPSNGFSHTWTFGEGKDFPAGYEYYIVELDESDQPLNEGQGGLISITNNDGIATGIITATNKINGSLTLKKALDAPQNEDVSRAAGKYNFTVTGPGETGTTKYVQIRIDSEGTVTYKVSNSEISFDETEGFANASSDGSVIIPDLIAGTYKVTEGEYQLDDDQDGKYTMNLGQLDVESGTADLSNGSAMLNVRAENTPSAAATFTNMLVPMVDVPVVKNWQWSEQDAGKVQSWTATFNLEYREVLVSGEEAADAKHSWTPVYQEGSETQESITLRSTDSDQEKFVSLPLYKTHENGSVYRLIYAVDEVAYTITYNDGRDPATETWSKSESGHLTEHYSPDYEQDAGEGDMPSEGMADWYTVHLTNVRSTKEIEKAIDLSLEKIWEEEELQNDPDSKATFQLKRTYHEEYLDYNKFNLDPNDMVTVKLNLGGGVTKQMVVPRGAPVYVTAVVKPGKTVNLEFSKDESEILLSGGDTGSASQQFINTSTPFLATADGDEINVSFDRGDASVLVGGLDGIGLASFDPEETTEEQSDDSFNNQPAGQEFTLDADHGWHKEWAGLPQTVQELSVTDNGTRLKTIVYSYYFEEKECCPKNYNVSFSNGQGDEDNPLISSASVVAENKLEKTELNGTKTWSLPEDSSYVLGTPVLKLTRRTELTGPEDVTVSWEGEEQLLQPTWGPIGESFTRSFTYTDLPKKDKDGNEYVYSVEEIEFTVGADENAVVYRAQKQSDGTYKVTIITDGKEGADTFVVTQDGNDIVNEVKKMTIEILKIDETTRDEESPTVLTGASFRLLKYDGSTYTAVDSDYGAATGVPVGNDGKLTFANLPNGEYKIVEVNIPAGYIKFEDNDIFFSVEGGVVTRYDSAVGSEGRAPIPATVEGEGDAVITNVVAGISYINDSATAFATFTVGNEPGKPLPHTGGTGTTLIYLIGALLTLGGGLLLVRRRRAVQE